MRQQFRQPDIRITLLTLSAYAVVVVLLSLFSRSPVHAQTDTPTPTATATATETSLPTATATPDTVVYGALDSGQAFRLDFTVDAGALFLGLMSTAQTLLLGLILMSLKRERRR